jgi:hypothetical protein
MNDVVVLELGAHEKVAHESRIFRDFDAHGIIDCPHRGQSMGVGSDSAGALHKMMGIPRIASLQDQLDPTEHLAGTPGVDNFAAGHFDLNSEVAFYSGDWIYRNSFSHMISSLFRSKGCCSHQQVKN